MARQGELVDRIEYLVDQTGDHVVQARGELIKAEEYRSKARKVKRIEKKKKKKKNGIDRSPPDNIMFAIRSGR